MRRFFVPPEQMDKSESVIKGSDVHHLRDVLRLQPDEKVIVFDGTGREYRAQILSVDRKEIRLTIGSLVRTDIDPKFDLAFAQGYLKDKKMDGLVRQLTELGVGRWMPFLSKRSIPVPDQKRLQGRYRRWQKISLESLKQCGRNHAMRIDPLVNLDGILERAKPYDLKIIFWEESKSFPIAHSIRKTEPSSVFLMVGPEGGFGPDEVVKAEKEGFVSAGLGPRILKAETAALAAAVMVQYLFGDMGE